MGKLDLAAKLNSIPDPSASYDALFGAADGEKIVRLRLTDLVFFEDQKTSMQPEDELQAMAQDIKENGVHEPIIVRTMPPSDNMPFQHYQVLNGRNRTTSSQLAGLEDIPAIIRNVNDIQARKIVSSTTIHQRRILRISELAWAYHMFIYADQGEADEQVHTVHLEDALKEAANEFEVSRRTIAYYLRLTYLVPELLLMIDSTTDPMPIRVGVALSYLPANEQLIVHAFLTEHRCKLTIDRAAAIKEYYLGFQTLSHQTLERLFGFERALTPSIKPLRFQRDDVNRLMQHIPSDLKSKGATDYLITAVRFYQENMEGTQLC